MAARPLVQAHEPGQGLIALGAVESVGIEQFIDSDTRAHGAERSSGVDGGPPLWPRFVD
jgi:hypothetical protein